MSWSLSTTIKAAEVPVSKTGMVPEELVNIDRSNIGNNQALKERDEQIDAAIDAALRILVQGGFDNAEEIAITMSGHANPEHKPVEGWSNETINVSVTIRKYRD